MPGVLLGGALGLALRSRRRRCRLDVHMHLARFHVAMRLMLWLPCLLSVQTLGKLNELIEENEVTGTCANGVCTVHGPGGKAEYSEVFEEFVPAFFAGAQVCR